MSTYKDFWEYRIKETFKNKEKIDDEHLLWHIVSLILYQNAKDTLLIELYKLFDDKENFIKLISLLDGRTFQSPTKKQMEEALLMSVLYYEKEIEGKDWEEIKSNFDFEFSTVKYGIRIKNMDNWLKQKINEIIRNEEQDNE